MWSPDPVLSDTDTGGIFSRFAYGDNNPVSRTDRDGNESGAFYTNDRYRMADPVLTPSQAEDALLRQVAVLSGPLAGQAVAVFRMGFRIARNMKRTEEIHSKNNPIAQQQRTTTSLVTKEDKNIVASGGRDLCPAQRRELRENEIAAKSPKEHAEPTALGEAVARGLTSKRMDATKGICPACQKAIEESGGKLVGQRSAEWK